MTARPPNIVLPPPDIRWDDDGTPRSLRYGDIYYSPRDGLAESRHVFLSGVGAPDLWRGRDHVVIAETGFGTGLNFLACWDLWRRTTKDAALDYIAVEGHPLEQSQLARALQLWPELADLAAPLIAAWPHRVPGYHHLAFDNGRVRLLLLFGDAIHVLRQLEAAVDAWFLDGFAPARNPEMWSAALFAEIARLSRPQARIASFTVAGAVRRGLEAQGFAVEKAPGFGAKRECLRGGFAGAAPAATRPAPWFAPAPPASGRRIAVIGGGIAGLMTAHALKTAGADPVLFERGSHLLPEASGNPAAIVEPWIDLGQSPTARLAQAASLHALRWYGARGRSQFEPCGVLLKDEDPTRLRRIASSGLLPAEAMMPVADGLLFPSAGIVHTAPLAAALAADLDVRLGVAVEGIGEDGDGWQLSAAGGRPIARADAVVLAAAFACDGLGGFPLSLVARRGQISYLPAGLAVDRVISGGVYVTPPVETADGLRHLVGATFNPADPSSEGWRGETVEDHKANLRGLAALLPGVALPEAAAVRGRTGLRATTVDHLPLVGGMPAADYIRDYQGLARGRREIYPPARYRRGLYVITALGARGYLTAPLLAQSLTALILGLPNPLPRSLMDALHPGRQAIRTLRRSR